MTPRPSIPSAVDWSIDEPLRLPVAEAAPVEIDAEPSESFVAAPEVTVVMRPAVTDASAVAAPSPPAPPAPMPAPPAP
ncbi:MAG: hypothetical protein Q8K58_07945, partial [Acidimicrobiales bacterium]|nr:hypothetical protein [Acidimicrobiales bacterium]